VLQDAAAPSLREALQAQLDQRSSARVQEVKNGAVSVAKCWHCTKAAVQKHVLQYIHALQEQGQQLLQCWHDVQTVHDDGSCSSSYSTAPTQCVV
jgi:hypothetical protein